MEKEKCVLCWAETQHNTDVPIQERDGYIETVGQLCLDCFDAVR